MTVEELLSRLRGVRRSGNGWTALCPSHEDTENSLSVGIGDAGRTLVKCFSGCPPEAIVSALGLGMRDLFPDPHQDGQGGGGKPLPVKPVTALHPPGLTLAALAEAKRLPESFLRELGVGEATYNGARVVRIPYFSPAGEILAVRFRLSLNGSRRFAWRLGDKVALYGLEDLQTIRESGWVLLVEGETDRLTGRYRKLPVLGIPGKAAWRSSWREYLGGVQVYLWQEPKAEDLTARVSADVSNLLVIPAPPGIKDLSEAHLQDVDIVKFIEELKAHAIPAERLRREQEDARGAELREQVSAILGAPDPLELVQEAIRAQGYGGDLKPPLIVYLTATSRLLKMRPGAMPVHIVLLGVPSVGKSYTFQVVLSLLPPEAYHFVDAGSPRALIYDTADLQHRVLGFSEADSLPAGEDNPAASAIRNLLQEHQLRYQVVVRDPDTGKFCVQEVRKPGPTVLVTTATKRLGAQLDSRVFSLEVPDDVKQVREALKTQASIELNGCAEPNPALVRYQLYLQLRTPWDVVVPFAEELSKAIGQSVVAPRILRDFSRLLALVKSVAILRHPRRRVDAKSRVVAEVEDYAAVYDLVKDMYEATVTGATERVRETVQAVKDLQATGMVTVTGLALHLNVSKTTAGRRVKVALDNGWLVNTEQRKGYPASLTVGEPLPEPTGLPHPDSLRGCNAVTPDTAGKAPPSPALVDLEEVEL